MNFSWILKDELAGSMGTSSYEELSFLYHNGVRAVIRMEEQTISADTRGMDLVDMFEPVTDFSAPRLDQVQRMIEFIDHQLANLKPVVVSCYAGIGRTGTVLACYLVRKGKEPAKAISRIRELRPKSIQTADQEATVYQYAQLIGR